MEFRLCWFKCWNMKNTVGMSEEPRRTQKPGPSITSEAVIKHDCHIESFQCAWAPFKSHTDLTK